MRKILLLAVCSVALQVYAQDTKEDVVLLKPYASKQKWITITQQPLQIFNWCWRPDIEIRLGKGPGWIQFGPSVYFIDKYDSNNSSHYYYDWKGNYNYYEYWSGTFNIREPFTKVFGYGLDIGYKHFINDRRTMYLAVGVSYTQFTIDYWGMGWEAFIQDGLQYYTYLPDYRTQHINRQGVNVLFGHQVPTRKAFVCDLFWGLAYRRSFSDEGKPSFDESMFSYGYTGIVLMTGVKLGFGFR